MPQDTKTTNIITAYKPSELIAIFNATLAKQNEFAKLVSLRGIYQQKQNSQNWAFAYAVLRDENTQDEITLRIEKSLFETLENGNLLTVIGVLERKIDPRGSVQITLNVTRVEKLQEQAVSLADQKKAELRRHKSQKTYGKSKRKICRFRFHKILCISRKIRNMRDVSIFKRKGLA